MIVFFKRYRMQFDLRGVVFEPEDPPAGFGLFPWRRSLMTAHADAKYHSFRNELDAAVFPCLGEFDGCGRLMKEISRPPRFVPESTWLLTWTDPVSGLTRNCGTVQGIRDQQDVGLIQNIGIVEEFRGLGLGSLIVRRSLAGFQSVGVKVVTLEVTTKNTGAIRLYKRLGFEIQKTVYKSVELPAAW